MADQPNSPQAQAAPHNSDPAQADQPQADPSQSSDESAPVYPDEVAEAIAATKAHFGDEGAQAAEESDSSEGGGEEAAKGHPSDKRPEARTEEVTPSTPPPADKVKASALATFHRQQKEFVAARQAQQQQLEQAAKIQKTLENAKDDPLAAVELMGFADVKSFLEKLAADGGRMTPERKELQDLKRWREQTEKQQADAQKQQQESQQQAQFQAKLDSLRSNIQTQIKSETYASRLINLPGADDQVMVEMDKLASETGEMPRVEDAIEVVEGRFRTYLEDMAKNPEIVEFFKKRVGAVKSAPGTDSQSKGREKPQTIGSQARSPGLTPTPKRKTNRHHDDDEVAEAIEWMSGGR